MPLFHPASAAAGERLLFDVHLHYDAAHRAQVPPERALAKLEGGGVVAGAVTGTPPETALKLHERAPRRIIPVLGVYGSPADKVDWHLDEGLRTRVAEALATGPWRAIGELHIFAEDRHSPVFLDLVDLAADRDLVLLMHCDPAVIDTLYHRRPDVTVIWAHAGRYPYPPLIRDYLARYPRLYVDLSKRTARITRGGSLDEDWALLLMELPGRFMVGVDTFSAGRWLDFEDHAAAIRRWLTDLPPEVADAVACANAARLFELPVCAGPRPLHGEGKR